MNLGKNSAKSCERKFIRDEWSRQDWGQQNPCCAAFDLNFEIFWNKMLTFMKLKWSNPTPSVIENRISFTLWVWCDFEVVSIYWATKKIKLENKKLLSWDSF